ncbi:YcxB family protein [Paenibacillus sp. 1001270B_150601_E10]|uniref:YcxB family protein n=1 Tax=Paenibacillus sp. 1001270B_150601_E10 TaxID=2787079 RepID=UPI00189DFB25|nr:YcxB family protein [Paenibacillus sp. 1001270B_150601_E10]
MNIHYEFTKEDYWKLNRDIIMMMPSYRLMLLAVLIGSPILFTVVLSYRFTLGVSIGISILLVMLVGLYIFYSVRGKIMRYAKTNPHVIGSRSIEISSDGVRDHSNDKESFQRWSDIKNIADRPDHILLMMNPTTVICVPKHAFANEDEAKRFYELAATYQKAAS